MISFGHKGNFKKTTRFLERAEKVLRHYVNFDKYAREGVAALESATPIDSGETSDSWSYNIEITRKETVITFLNNNIEDGIPIVILIQYGHGTRNGGYVEGRDFINPAIQPIFDKIANEAWKEVSKL